MRYAGLILSPFLLVAASAFAQDDPAPPDGQVAPPAHARTRASASQAVPATSRDAERAAALARGRKRFFEQQDVFGSESPPPSTVNSVFPVGPNGLPIVTNVPRGRRR